VSAQRRLLGAFGLVLPPKYIQDGSTALRWRHAGASRQTISHSNPLICFGLSRGEVKFLEKAIRGFSRMQKSHLSSSPNQFGATRNSHQFSPTGGPIGNRDDEKNEGPIGGKIVQNSRNSCRLNSQSCECIGTADSGSKCVHS